MRVSPRKLVYMVDRTECDVVGDGRAAGVSKGLRSDAALEKTTQTWNARGNLVRVVDAATNIIGKAYDVANNLIFLTNRNANLWQFQYDEASRLTNTISPLIHASSQVYNNRGLLQSTTAPLSQTTSFGYDARARMTSKTNNLGVYNYQYDGDNNLTLLTKAGGAGLSWVYERLRQYSGQS